MKHLKKTAIFLILALILTVGLFAGCSAAAQDNYVRTDTPSSAEKGKGLSDSEGALEYESAGTPSSGGSSGSGESQLDLGVIDPSRKLIYHVNYTLETKEFAASVSTLNGLVSELGGYVESSSTSGGNGSARSSTYSLRIPSDKLQDFIRRVNTIGNITSEDLSTQDVTLEYTDVESHLSALRTQESRLLALMDRAESVSEILELENALSNVRYQIESLTSRLNTLKSLISYSTVTIRLREVIEYTPVEREYTFGERLSEAFRDSLSRLSDGFQSFGVWLLGNSLEILLWLAVIAGIVVVHILVIRAIVRGARRRRARAAAARTAAPAAAPAPAPAKPEAKQ